jgi:hypothetical protein
MKMIQESKKTRQLVKNKAIHVTPDPRAPALRTHVSEQEPYVSYLNGP